MPFGYFGRLIFPHTDSYGHQLQVRQVRESDVLKQKAYMLFYVRNNIENSVARKDNSTSNMLMKKTPEKISSLNGVTQSSVKAQNRKGVSPFGDKTHSAIIGYSTIFSKIETDHSSNNDVKAEDAPASQNNALPSKQAPGARNDGGTFSTKQMQFALNSQETSSSQQSAPFTNTCGKQTVVGRSLQATEPKADAGKNISIVSPIANGAATLSKEDKLTSQPQTVPCSKPTAHLNDTAAEFAARYLSNKVCMMVTHCMFFLNNLNDLYIFYFVKIPEFCCFKWCGA